MRIIKGIEAPNETYKKGDIIFQEKTPSECFFIIKEGKVGVYKHHGKKKSVLLTTITPGRVLGELSSMDGLPRSATAVALTDVQVTKVSSKVLKYQLEQCPVWFKAIILDLVERLRKSGDLLVEHHIEDPNLVSSQERTDKS